MIKLTPPNLSNDNIDRRIICVRPKRQGGARIEYEPWNGKHIIHNYGHGGFGWSLLPGSVMHALAIFEQALHERPSLKRDKKVTVIGAGCFGLLTAIFLHERGWNVTVIAEQTTQLASHKAAGSLAVIAIKASRANQPLMDQVSVDSYVFYKNLSGQHATLFSGVSPIPVYKIHQGTPNYRYPLVTAGVMQEAEEVVVDFGNGVTHKANKFSTFALDTAQLMQNFMNTVLAYKIPIIEQKILTLADAPTSIVFNCAGLGARAWDSTIVLPVQGHLVTVKNQPTDALGYMIYAHIRIDGTLQEVTWTPKGGGTLGASVINGEDRLDANPELADTIIRNARIFFGGC